MQAGSSITERCHEWLDLRPSPFVQFLLGHPLLIEND